MQGSGFVGVTEQRLAGFRRRAAELGLRVVEDAVLLGEFSIEWGEASVERLTRGGTLPDAVVCGDDLIALGVTRACRARGLAVPDQLQVTGFDNIEFARLSEPALTTVDQPRDQIAAEAVRLLVAAGAGNGSAARTTTAHIALTPTLIVRDSTRSDARSVLAASTGLPAEVERHAAAKLQLLDEDPDR